MQQTIAYNAKFILKNRGLIGNELSGIPTTKDDYNKMGYD